MKRMLIVSYSVTNGNTKKIAQQMQKATGAHWVALETAVPYTGTYGQIVDQGKREVDVGYQPALKPLPVSLQDYEIIAVGTPTWWYTMAPAVRSFLHSQDWTGKTVVPFQTHGGWPGHTLQDMKDACKGARFAWEMAVQFDSTGGPELVTPQGEIDAWTAWVKAGIAK